MKRKFGLPSIEGLIDWYLCDSEEELERVRREVDASKCYKLTAIPYKLENGNDGYRLWIQRNNG